MNPNWQWPHSGWRWLGKAGDSLGPRWVFYMGARSHARVVPFKGKWIVWIARRGTSANPQPTYGEWKRHLMTNPDAFDDLEEAKRYAETVVRLEAA